MIMEVVVMLWLFLAVGWGDDGSDGDDGADYGCGSGSSGGVTFSRVCFGAFPRRKKRCRVVNGKI